MDTFCIEYLLNRIFGLGTTMDCRKHVFGKEVAERYLCVPVKTRWFRKCTKCHCRRVYADMVQCFECQGYAHEGCVSWESELQDEQRISADRARTATLVDASTNTVTPVTGTPAADTPVVVSKQRSASVPYGQRMVADVTIVTTTTENSAIGPMDVATAMDCDRDLATAILETVDGTVSSAESCTAVDTTVQVTATAARNENLERTEVTAGPSNVPRIVAATVTPVSHLEVTCPNDLKETLEKWATRFEQFSKFDHGVMADRESLYSGPPEVLAKRFADQHETFDTVIDPFCGAGAIAIQMAMVCRKVIAMDRDPLKIKLAKNNARLYGVNKNIIFIVGDFFERGNRLRADAIVTTPPVEFSVGVGNLKIEDLITLASRVAPKLLFRLPTDVDRAELYRWGSKHFNNIKFEEVCVDGLMNCVNFHLSHTTKNKSYVKRNSSAMKANTRVLLYNEELTGNRRFNFVRTNDLRSYDLYLRNVEDFLERQRR